MSWFEEVLFAMIGLGWYKHLFCFPLQIKRLFEMLVGDARDVAMEEDAVEREKLQSCRTYAFKVETKSLHYALAPRIYCREHQIRCLEKMSIIDCAIVFYSKVDQLMRC